VGEVGYRRPAAGGRSGESRPGRLALWDISAEQIGPDREKRANPFARLTICSSVQGIVSAKVAVQGNRVMPSDSLYDIVDLSSIWVLADLYEMNVPFVKIGDSATISLSYRSRPDLQGAHRLHLSQRG